MIQVKWLGQAGYLIQVNSTVICIDPYLSDCVFEVEGMPRLIAPPVTPAELRCDLLVTTHDHMDHLDPAAIPEMDRQSICFAGPKSCIAHLMQLGIGSDNLLPFDRGQKVRVGDVQLTAVFADHTPDSIGVLIEAEGKRLYFTGDTLYNDDLGADAAPVDALFCCINGKLGNMTAEQAAEVAETLRPKLVIPNHFGMFAGNTVDPSWFLSEMKRLGIPSRTLPVGEYVCISDLL